MNTNQIKHNVKISEKGYFNLVTSLSCSPLNWCFLSLHLWCFVSLLFAAHLMIMYVIICCDVMFSFAQ